MEHIKDDWARQIEQTKDSHGNRGHSNWIETDRAQKLIRKMREKFPHVEITLSDEHFIIPKKNGVMSYIPRWEELDTSSDGKRPMGKITVEDMILKILEEDE